MAYWEAAMWDGYKLRLTVTQSSQSVSGNYSIVAYSLQIIRPSGQADWASDPSSWATNIGGQTNSGTKTYDFGDYSVLTLTSGSKTIAHNSDGTKSISVSGSFSDAGGQIGSASISPKTFTLTTIPRASQPTMSASAVDAGDPITILTHRASASFTHTITYKIGSLTGTIATKTSVADVPWTPPLSLINAIPSATSGSCTITVETFSGSTSLGSKTTSFTLRVPTEIVPDFTTISHSDANSLVASTVGAYVKDLSKLTLTIGGEVGAYGSTITARKIVVAGQTINADSGTTPNPINVSGTVTVTGTVTDSRGRTKTKTVNVTVLDWKPPVVPTPTLQRSNISGTPQTDGTTIKVGLDVDVSSLMNGTQKNTLTYRVYTRLRGSTTWALAAGPTVAAGVSFTGSVLVSSYAIEDSWDVKVEVSDKFATTAVQGTVATAAIDVHFDAKLGVGIGKFRENGKLDVAGDIYMSGTKVSVVGHVHSGADITTGTVPAARLPAASDTAAGIVERATQTEVNTGTDNSRYVTPATLRGNENLPSEAAWGHANYTSNINNGSGATVSVTFPSGRFTGVPRVVASVGSSARLNIAVLSITSTGFSFRLDNWSGAVSSPNGADWIAMR